ncbi:MAG: hypothetical protein ACI8XC_002716 [Gammaproteobacteria bacterium]
MFLKNAIAPDNLKLLQDEFEQWKAESRAHNKAYGNTFDNRPRFDIEPGYCAERPALLRIASPIKISQGYLDLMRNNKALDAVVDLIGPNLRFNHSKIYSTQPGDVVLGSETGRVRCSQYDMAFTEVPNCASFLNSRPKLHYLPTNQSNDPLTG